MLTVWCCRIWKIGFHTELKTLYRNGCKVRRRIPLHTWLEIKATGLTAWLERWPMRELEGIKYVSFTCDSTTMFSSTLCYRNNIPSSNQSKLLIFIRLNCESCVLCLWGQRDPVTLALKESEDASESYAVHVIFSAGTELGLVLCRRHQPTEEAEDIEVGFPGLSFSTEELDLSFTLPLDPRSVVIHMQSVNKIAPYTNNLL